MSKDRRRAEDDVLADSPFEGDLDAQLQPKPRRVRLPGATVWLTAGVVAVGGFLGGVQAHKSWGSDTQGQGGGGLAAQRPGGTGTGGYGGFGGQGGQGGGRTIGTVTKVEGGYLYLKTTDGRTVKVKTGDDTKITLSEDGKASDLKSGASVVVNGETGSDGTLTATSVTEGGGTGGGMGGPPGGSGDRGAS